MTTTNIADLDVERVQRNLSHMIQFNDQTYLDANAYIDNCFSLLTETDSSDFGPLSGMSVLEDCLDAIGDCLDPLGTFSAAFMCSILNSYTQTTPANLNQTFSNMVIRVDRTHQQLNQDIAYYIQNTRDNWDREFTWKDTTITLGDLATIDFPDEKNPDFWDPLEKSALRGFDQGIWTVVLNQNCKISRLVPAGDPDFCYHVKGKNDINSWYLDFLAKNPAFYCTWTWHEKHGLFDSDQWFVNEYCLNFKDGTKNKWHCIPNAACQYLFINSADGVVINSNGLFDRSYVFNNLPLEHVVFNV